jgi:hypothetical protein
VNLTAAVGVLPLATIRRWIRAFNHLDCRM